MSTIVLSKSLTIQSVPTAQSYVTIYQSYLIAGLKQLRHDCEDLVIPAGLLLGDMASLIQLDELQTVDVLGVDLASWLNQVAGEKHEAE